MMLVEKRSAEGKQRVFLDNVKLFLHMSQTQTFVFPSSSSASETSSNPQTDLHANIYCFITSWGLAFCPQKISESPQQVSRYCICPDNVMNTWYTHSKRERRPGVYHWSPHNARRSLELHCLHLLQGTRKSSPRPKKTANFNVYKQWCSKLVRVSLKGRHINACMHQSKCVFSQ